ncbi:DUF465 domain-containing protein [Vibrio sp. F13]|uniref:YdcH family protein n=1 Tax=unclassified Vibrio TaxID=2614977 RepID=UPI0010BDCEBF|nr:YdcH family protein [Vibrio sp. F13]TKF44905.1 DUF465 domain-containing protein [Vibrio sp. F13]TKF54125.1 DUF465 domain-containing protein [Vibrio sp. F13]
MLGENHSLVHEFPEMKDKIAELAKTDDGFAADMKTYDNLDKEIRKLELKDSPIDDGSMHQLKHDRSVLKDALHARLTG